MLRSYFRPLLPVTLLLLAGCSAASSNNSNNSTGQTGSTTPPPPAQATTLYVPEVSESFANGPGTPATSAASEVLEFSTRLSGPITPTATLTSLNTTDVYLGIATDSTGNLYVGSFNVDTSVAITGKLLVFAAGATGAATPTRVITGSATQLGLPLFVAVDTAGNIYTTSNNAILEFAAGANGNVAPIRTITNVGGVSGLAVDPSGNIVFAHNSGVGADSIEIFSSTQSGNATPVKTISGANVNIEQIGGLALDSAGNIYVASQKYFYTGQDEIIIEFAGGTSPTTAIIKSISGDGSLRGDSLLSVAVDAAGLTYILEEDGLGNGDILKFFAEDKGAATPIESSSHLLATTLGPIAVH